MKTVSGCGLLRKVEQKYTAVVILKKYTAVVILKKYTAVVIVKKSDLKRNYCIGNAEILS
jgi:hypothetical protein